MKPFFFIVTKRLSRAIEFGFISTKSMILNLLVMKYIGDETSIAT
jgi:hypothetical protein